MLRLPVLFKLSVFCLLMCFGIQGKPSLNLNFNLGFPNFGNFAGFNAFRNFRDVAGRMTGGTSGTGGTGGTDAAGGVGGTGSEGGSVNGADSNNGKQVKIYSGNRVKNDSLLMVYFHDQTVAIVELGAKKLLLNCELIEIYDHNEVSKVLGNLKRQRPVPITFNEMTTLMSQCQQIDNNRRALSMDTSGTSSSASTSDTQNHRQFQINTGGGNGRGFLGNNPLSLFSGIIPCTKWCGTGDIASTYHDLGMDSTADMCCRTHDLCPVKVRAYGQRYNLTNNSVYTKSHCQCDDTLYDCFKHSDSPVARIMGNVYFNIIQVPCVMDTPKGRRFRKAKSNF